MTVRFSNPSQGIGVNRFKCWPSKTTDSYSTTDLSNNFDKLDAMFGVPSAGTAWPSVEGVDGGVYREVKLLQNDRTPIGTIIPWWRPSSGIAIPTGWVEVIGQTLTTGQHDFAGGGSITLPDLRNKFILGADSTLAALTPSAGVGTGAIDTPSGAPGLGYVGGSNQTILVIANLPAHDHGGGAHNHGGGNHAHGITDSGHNHPVNDPGHTHSLNRQVIQLPSGGPPYTFDVRDQTTNTVNTNSALTGISVGGAGTGITINASGSILSTDSPIQSQGSGTAFTNRPAYVGLIFLMRVKYSTAP